MLGTSQRVEIKVGEVKVKNLLVFISILALSQGCAPETAQHGVAVRVGDYGDKWPLMVSEARLDCDVPDIAFIEANGKRYALNGGALRAGLPRPDEIRKETTTIFMADFTEKAMQICIDKRK